MRLILLIIVCALLAGWLKNRGVRRTNCAIGGVCAGLASHFGWDVKVTRIIAFVLALCTGVPVVFYIIACIVLPKD